MAAKILAVANWKMNPPTWREAKKLFEATRRAAEKVPKVAVVVAPPAIYLRELRATYRGRRIALSLQHAHFEAGGAHTGEISLVQGKDAGATYVLVGHAERRAAGETNDDTRKKVAAALEIAMLPILCVGERERTEDGAHFHTVREQIRAGFADVAPSAARRVTITYEPLWTIGKKDTMNPRDMHEMAIFIRKTVVDLRGGVGHGIRILYGGSVDEKNASAMLRFGDVRGFLVGRASTDAEEFTKLLQVIGSTQVRLV